MMNKTNVKHKKLVLLCQHFYPEMISTGMHMTELACALKKLGWEIDVICAQPSLAIETENKKLPNRMSYKGINIRRTVSLGNYRSGLISRGFCGLAFTFHAFLILLFSKRRFGGLLFVTNPPFLGLVGVMLKLFRRFPYVMIVYDIYPDIVQKLGVVKSSGLISEIWKRLTKLILKNANKCVVIGRDMSNIIALKIGAIPESLPLIHNWADVEIFTGTNINENRFQKEYNPQNAFVVQYSGNMGRSHNIEVLIDAAEMLIEENVVFQFIGDGAKKEKLKALVKEKALTNVQFLSYQPLKELNQVIGSANLAVACLQSNCTGLSVPSKSYGIMAAGTPLLALMDANSEIGQAVVDHKCGYCLENAKVKQIVRIIKELIDSPEKQKEMSNAGRTAFEENYTLMRSAKKYDDVLQKAFYNIR